jgi:hypothetical protein
VDLIHDRVDLIVEVNLERLRVLFFALDIVFIKPELGELPTELETLSGLCEVLC